MEICECKLTAAETVVAASVSDAIKKSLWQPGMAAAVRCVRQDAYELKPGTWRVITTVLPIQVEC